MDLPSYTMFPPSSTQNSFFLHSSHLPIMMVPDLFPVLNAEPGNEAEDVSVLTDRASVFYDKYPDIHTGVG